jgi:Major Facilitator Superfamily
MRADATGLRWRFVLLTGLRWLPIGFTTPLLVLLPLSRGLTLEQVGITMACYAATTALLELPTGGLADAVGRRPVLGASSVVLGLVVFASMLVAEGLGPWIAVKLLAGAARALDSGPLEAWYVDEVRRRDPRADIRKGLSRAHAAEGGGLALTAVAGGLLPVAFGGSLNAAVLAALVAQGVYLVGLLTLMTNHPKSDRRAPGSATRRVPAVIRTGLALGMGRAPVSWLLCGSAVWGAALVGIELLWQPRFTDLLDGRSDTGPLGFLMAGAFLAAAAGSAMAPRLARLVGGGTSRSAMACALTSATIYLALAAAGSIAVAAPAFIMVYLMGGARGPYHNELLHEHVAAEQRSTMLSAASLSLMAGGLVSSLTLPALVGVAGIPWAWALVGSVLGASSLLYLAIPDRPTPVVRRTEHEPAPVAVT